MYSRAGRVKPSVDWRSPAWWGEVCVLDGFLSLFAKDFWYIRDCGACMASEGVPDPPPIGVSEPITLGAALSAPSKGKSGWRELDLRAGQGGSRKPRSEAVRGCCPMVGMGGGLFLTLPRRSLCI